MCIGGSRGPAPPPPPAPVPPPPPPPTIRVKEAPQFKIPERAENTQLKADNPVVMKRSANPRKRGKRMLTIPSEEEMTY